MSWSRFHSTNFQGPVPTGEVVPKAWSPTVSTCFLFTIGKKTSRSSSSGKGLSVMMCTVSASTTFTSLIARMLPYWGDFLVWSMTRSNEYFTSAGVRTSPLWKRTFLRILNSHWVSVIAFHEVASDGSNCELGAPVQQGVEHVDVHEDPDPLEVHVGVEGRGVGHQGDGQRVLGLGGDGRGHGGQRQERQDEGGS